MTKRPNLADSLRKLNQPAAAPIAPTTPSAPPAAPESTPPKGYYAATRAGRKKVTATLEPEAHTQLKVLAARRSETVEDLLREAVSDLFRKYDLPEIS